MDYTFIIGITAAILTTSAFLPQVIKTHRSRQTKDISLLMLVILVCGLTLWSIYGVLSGALPVILANLITLILVIYLLVLKLRY